MVAEERVCELFKQASLTGNLRQLRPVELAIRELIPAAIHPGDLHLIHARLAFRLHRLDDVARSLDAIPGGDRHPEVRAMRADLEFHHGHYEQARSQYAALIDSERTWDNIARLAHLIGCTGDPDRADSLYAEAEDELTAKEMRSYCWLEVQRGLLDFRRGRFEEAGAHYRRAETAFPDYWYVAEHRAELSGAQGEYGAAIAVLRRIVAGTPRPELDQALGELHALAGNADEAGEYYARALTAYLDSVSRAEVHFFHHLVDFYSDAVENGPEAVKWARRDLEIRNNFATQSALAWALYRNGEHGEARQTIGHVLDGGMLDAHTLHRAAQICGNEELAARALRINPYVDGFHIHH